MKIKYSDGKTDDVTTGVARRLIQSGEAVEYDGDDSDKRKPAKSRTAGVEKDHRSDVSSS